MLENKKYFLAILAMSLLFCLPVFLDMGKSLFTGDNDIYWPVSRFFIFNSFHESGKIPLWDPNVYGGIPLLANPQSIMIFPLYFLFTLLDFGIVLKLALLFLVLFSGISMFYFLKVLGLKNDSSFFGAIAYMFAGRIMSSIWAGHIVFWPPYAFLPLLFAFFELSVKNKSAVYAAFAGIILSLMFFGGHTQLFLYFMLFFFFYVLFRLFASSADRPSAKNLFVSAKKIVPFFFLIMLVFSLISMVQILPSLEFASLSSREGGLSDETANFAAFRAENFITVLLPNFFGNSINHTFWGRIYYDELNFFPGTITLIFALLAFIFFRNNYVKFFSAMVLFSFAFAFGSSLFLFDFFRLLPVFELLRVPSRMLFVAAFCVPVIAAFGFDRLLALKDLSSSQKNFFKIIFVLSLFVLTAVILSVLFRAQIFELGRSLMAQKYSSHSLEQQQYYISRIPAVFNWILRDLLFLFFALFSVSFSAWLYFGKKAIGRKLFSVIIIGACLLELFSFGMIFTSDLRNGEIFEKNDAINFLESQKPYFRVFEQKMFPWFHKTVSAGIQSALSYDPAIFRNYADFLGLLNNKNVISITTLDPGDISDKSNLRVLDLLNVKYVVSGKKLDLSFPVVYEDINYFIYENASVLPRAFVLGNAKAFDSEKKVLNNILSPEFNPREEILLQGRENSLDSSQDFMEAEITFYSPDRIIVSAELSDEGYLVLLENNYPGWKAFEKGKELPVVTANYLFRAVKLPEGKHEIEFVFLSETIFWGAAISLISLAGVIAFLVLQLIKKRV